MKKETLFHLENMDNITYPDHHYCTRNQHPRDTRISFEPISHTYQIQMPGDKVETFISATTIIHKYFPEFDADKIIEKMMKSYTWKKSPYYGKTVDEIKQQWEDNRNSAAAKGTQVHDWIENYYLGEFQPPCKEAEESKSFQNFLEFHKDYGWMPYRTEWRVFTEDFRVAGSIDIIFEGSEPGKIKVFDWKNSKEIKMENRYEKGFEPLQHLPNCNFYHYSLQLNLYKWILEHHYGQQVEEMGLIIVHENNPTYLKYEVKDMQKEIQMMLEHYRSSGFPLPVKH
jgi:ATP-dependent exoDNAse (exonuclease V) beta subunit